MVESRTRDKVWLRIVANIRSGKSLTVRDVQESVGCAERTARDVLEVAARNGDLLDVREEETGRRIYRPKVEFAERDTRAESEL